MHTVKRKPAGGSAAAAAAAAAAAGSKKKFERSTLARGTHPLGVQPLGNLYLSTTMINQRDVGLGILRFLSDEMIQELLSRLSPNDLVVLSQVSKALYVFCHQEDLWRDLTIKRFQGDFWFAGTWKKTFAAKMREIRNQGKEGETADPTEQRPSIKVEGFYSDYLFQSWYCSSRQIDREWLKGDNIDRRSGLTMTVEEFIREYEEPNKPVVITDIVKSWPAYELWTKEYLRSKFRGVTFKAEAVDMTMEKYLQYSEATTDEAPIYLFDRSFCEKMEGASSQFEVPAYFAEDLFSVLGKERPDYRWLIIGPARSGSTFHKDPNSTSAWNAVISGSKKWIMYPPDVVPPGVFPSKDGAEVTTSISLMEWFINFYPHTRIDDITGRVKPLECIVNAGEIMFVPNGWWHTVLNVEDSVAVTQNYVSGRNLKNVLRFIKDCGEQVSGYRAKGSLYDKFVGCLQKEERYLELLKELNDENADDLGGEDGTGCARKKQKVMGLWDTLRSNKPSEGGQAEDDRTGKPAAPFTFGFVLGDD